VTNQVYSAAPTSRRQPALCLSTITANQPVLIGTLPAVAVDTAANVVNNTPSFDLAGSFSLTCTAKSSLSPSTNSQIKPGDKLYADGGSLDATSNMTTGFTIDKNTSGTFFGYADPSGAGLAAGTTGTLTVILGGPGL
jgi:hypothetical protein